MPGSAPLWPAGGPRWTADHPSMPGSAPPWPAAGPSSPRTGGRAAAPRRGTPPELHHDRRSRAASVSGISLGRNPVGNWGPSGAPAVSPADRAHWRSAQFVPTTATQAQYEAAPGDWDQVVLTKAPPARPDRETAWDARGGTFQLTADAATELASPVALEAAERPNADSVRLAGRILSVADDRAAEIMQQASDRAAEITRQASGQAAVIRAAAEQEAAEITRQASGQAAVIRAAAEQEAAELRASLMTMSAELSRVATYVTGNLAAPAKPATRPAERPVTKPSDRPAFQPVTRPVTKPSDRPAAEPAARPATKPAALARQHAARRLTRLITAVLILFAAVCGTTEIALHGFSFFVFRSAGTGSTPGNGLQEDQGPGQPNAPGTHHHHVTGHKP